ncbi:hypothetical protein N0M98_30300 [Paenibacillus doosanensis]|nr:hypothetical protein [Paenibacillus doosanensis]
MYILSNIFIITRFKLREVDFLPIYSHIDMYLNESLGEGLDHLKKSLVNATKDEEVSEYIKNEFEAVKGLSHLSENYDEVVKYQPIVKKMIEELLQLLREKKIDTVFCFVDLFHNFPKNIVMSTQWNPDQFWKHDVRIYRKESKRTSFLVEYQKDFIPAHRYKLFFWKKK